MKISKTKKKGSVSFLVTYPQLLNKLDASLSPGNTVILRRVSAYGQRTDLSENRGGLPAAGLPLMPTPLFLP